MALNVDVLHRALAQLDTPDPEAPGPPESEPRDPVPRRRGLRSAPPDNRKRDTVSIDEARQMIRTNITTYLAEPLPDHMLLIAAPAGIGKTTLGVETAERMAGGGKIMYVVPRKEFFSDLMALASRPQWWYLWQSRHGGDASGLGQTCRWPHQIDAWLKRGYMAREFCANPRICGWNYVHSSCRYYAQEQQTADIIVAQYEHVALGHLLMDRMHLIIGDELPIRGFLNPWHIPTAKIVPGDMADLDTRHLLERLQTLASIRNTSWRGPELLEMLGGADHVLAVCEHSTMDASAVAYTPDLRSPDSVEDVPYFHLPALISLLKREARRAVDGQESISRVKVDSSGLTLLLRHAPRNLPPHVVWLDATANARLYETLFERPVKVVRPDVALQGHVRQVWAGLNNKMSLTSDAGAKLDHLQAQIARITSFGYNDVRYVTYKDFVRVLAPDDRDLATYFGGSRGTNKLEGCDCLIVVGAPQAPTAQLIDMAAMLYHERDEPFDAIWSTRDRAYDGQPWAWPIGGFWNDQDLQTLLEQNRESELIQAIHRARPLIRDVDVWLLTNVPLEGVPVELVSLQELFDAPAGVDPYRWPDVITLAEERIDRAGIVTTADLVDASLCQKSVARKYLETLAAQQGYLIVRAPAAGRGQPPMGCVKNKQVLNTSVSPISNL